MSLGRALAQPCGLYTVAEGRRTPPKEETLSYVHSVEYELGLILFLSEIREENVFTL